MKGKIMDYNTFFNIKMPKKGYHCPNGEDELHIEKNLTLECGCGKNHSAKEAFAHIVFPVENKTLYSCPHDKFIFVLVKPKGFFKIKGLKTIGIYKAGNEDEQKEIISEIEKRKKK